MEIKLKELCDKKNITLYQLAEYIGVDRNTIYSWVNNRSFPRPSQLNRLIEFFNCEVQDLIKKS